MDPFTPDELRSLLAQRQSPCIWLHVPIKSGDGFRDFPRSKETLGKDQES